MLFRCLAVTTRELVNPYRSSYALVEVKEISKEKEIKDSLCETIVSLAFLFSFFLFAWIDDTVIVKLRNHYDAMWSWSLLILPWFLLSTMIHGLVMTLWSPELGLYYVDSSHSMSRTNLGTVHAGDDEHT